MSIEAVINGQQSYHLACSDAQSFLREIPKKSVRMIFGSPPYPLKGERYDAPGKRPKWQVDEWIELMLGCTKAAVECCYGDVFWVVNNTVSKHQYHPAIEGLLWRCYQEGLVLDRPAIWHKNAPPSRKDYFGNAWEFVIAFKGYHGARSCFNWDAIAKPPAYSSGGHFRQRDTKGVRRKGNSYPKGELARPRDVHYVTVGGGHMGSELAHKNEAPYPEKLVEKFVPVFSNPGDVVVDPFLGSGTTAKVALKHERRFLGCDLRPNQLELSEMRLKELQEG